MDTTIRNIDEEAYHRLRAYASYHQITIGDALSRLVMQHVEIPRARPMRSFFAHRPRALGPGTERLSEQVDEILYGRDA